MLVGSVSLDEAITEIEQEISDAVDFAKDSPFPEARAAADHVYA